MQYPLILISLSLISTTLLVIKTTTFYLIPRQVRQQAIENPVHVQEAHVRC